jgi:hypothetical protein
MNNKENDATASASSIKQFCIDHAITPPTYFKLREQGLGPKEMRLGTLVRISKEAAAEWRKARENPQGDEATTVAKTATALQARAQRAAKRAIQSSKHVSNRGGM